MDVKTIFGMSNKTFDRLKFVAQIVIPAIAVFYFTMSQIWGLPAGEEVVGTLTAIDLLLGTILGISSKQYAGSPQQGTAGDLLLDTTTENTGVLVQFENDPADLEGQVTLNVKKIDPSQ